MDLYQHFRKEEHPFIDQVLSWRQAVETSYQSKLTDFLDPREQTIFSSIIGNSDDVVWGVYGGHAAERKRAVLAPYYVELTEEDYQIVLLEAKYPDKFVKLEHRDVLGAFLSLGMKRKKIGDITVGNGIIQIVVTADIASFVKMNFNEVKMAKVTFIDKDLDEKIVTNESWVEQDATVSSLRLDVVLKEMFRISRQQAVTFVQKGLVKVNFRVIEDPAFKLAEGDLLSLRGKGRGKITRVDGMTKKEKWKITIEKLK
ncbi:RNA-binding protein [Aquibacillus sp. 3ASR75-11]|uniref:RNA-binding protein n=1 Tax=Terrihalobacillus insolitus TaxID=2950438 RepID=A0A9X3WR00_9BACI|nr:RNA-binding protein [Terrihalobacillus insolitus]MDC3412849.1 RNA-binding protein [Terrihalobacillus insolitus]MDC3423675.1 RNA-binding protein [Terrihalobacillus insolitus]